jgi:hypothetical protein
MIAQSFQGIDVKGFNDAMHNKRSSERLAGRWRLLHHPASIRVLARTSKESINP